LLWVFVHAPVLVLSVECDSYIEEGGAGCDVFCCLILNQYAVVELMFECFRRC